MPTARMWYGTDKGVSHCDRNNMWTHYLAAANGANTQVLSLDQAPDGGNMGGRLRYGCICHIQGRPQCDAIYPKGG